MTAAYGDAVYGDAIYGGASGSPDTEVPAGRVNAYADDRWEWHGPHGDIETFYVFRPGDLLISPEPEGIGAPGREAFSASAPGQRGATLRATRVPPRVVSFPLVLFGTDVAQTRERFASLARSLMVNDSPFAEPSLGMLYGFRHGRPDIQIPCHPVDESPRMVGRISPTHVRIAVDFYCPDPLFRSVDSRAVWLAGQVGGWHVLEGDTWHVLEGETWSVLGGNAEQVVDYTGDADAPVVVEVQGEIEGARIANATYGDEIVLTGTLGAGERLIVSTAGPLSVRHVDASGVSSDGWSFIDKVESTMWRLRRGSQTITLTSVSNVSGRARVSWHDWHAAA